MLRRCVVGCALASSLGCSEPARDPPGPPVADKKTLYADATLVPTREGERRRTEIALAGEIEQALRVFPELEHVRVHVEAATPVRVAVFGRAPPELAEQLRATAEQVVTAIVGPEADRVTSIAAHPSPEPEHAPIDILLAFALWGLGISMGITADRLVRRYRR